MMAILGAVLACVASGPDVELVAHRGESADAPENTLAAFRLAWERKVPAIELDVHLTKDHQLIVSHDATTKRTTGVDKAIKDRTLDELRPLDVGRWKDARWQGERMPTLGEALWTIPDGARCFIEVKVGAEAIPALVETIRKSGKRPEQLAIISFQADAVAEAKKALPEIPAYYLASFQQDAQTQAWSPSVDDLIRRAQAIGADGLDLAGKGPLDREAVVKIKAAGLKVYVWTIDDPAEAKKFVAAGVDGITTNKAGWMREQLEAANGPAGR